MKQEQQEEQQEQQEETAAGAVYLWSVERVSEWVTSLGFSADIAAAFTREGIDGRVLEALTAEDLKALGVGRLGDRIRILQEVRSMSAAAVQDMSVPFHFDESTPFATDAEYLDAVKSHFLLKKMKVQLVEAARDCKSSDSSVQAGALRCRTASLDKRIAASRRVIEKKLAVAEQTPGRMLPRLVRSAQHMKMSGKETWALAFMLIRSLSSSEFIDNKHLSGHSSNSLPNIINALCVVKQKKRQAHTHTHTLSTVY